MSSGDVHSPDLTEMVSAAAARAQVARILASRHFAKADRLKRFLRFVTEETLKGLAAGIKETVIGVEVFDRRSATYDPRIDPIVRVQAGRVRAKLDELLRAGRGWRPCAGRAAAWTIRAALQRAIAAPAPTTRHAGACGAGGLAVEHDRRASLREYERRSRRTSISATGLTEELTHALARLPSVRITARRSAFQFKGRDRDIREIGRLLGAGQDRRGERPQGRRQAADHGSVGERRRRISAVVGEVRPHDERRVRVAGGDRRRDPTRPLGPARRGPEPRPQPQRGALMRSITIFWADSTGTSGTRPASAPASPISARRSGSILTTGAPIPASPIATSCSPCRAPRHRPPACRWRDKRRSARWKSTTGSSKPTRPLPWCARISIGTGAGRKSSSSARSNAIRAMPRSTTGTASTRCASEGRFDEAEDEIEWAEQLDPISLPINLGHAQMLYLGGDCPAAIAQCMKVLGLDASYYRAYWFLGLAHDRLGNFEAASDALETARARGGSEVAFRGRILGALGHTYGRWGKPDRAAAILDEMAAMSRSSYVDPFEIAQVHAGLGQDGRGPRQSGARRRGPVGISRLLRRVAGFREPAAKPAVSGAARQDVAPDEPTCLSLKEPA